jgi:TetR/AcrR family transcriptional repressor of lmrAB and yxaGH operons
MKAPSPNPARDKIIESAITLMRRTGLSGAGINEIVRISGAPKGSVYHYFPAGKRQIVEQGLAQYAQRVVAFIDAAMAGKRGPKAKVVALFAAFAHRLEEGDFRHSCPIGTVCLDLGEAEADLRPVLATAFEDFTSAIAGNLAFADRKRARSFASLALTAIEGAYVRGRADRSIAAFREAGAWLGRLAEMEAKR